MSSINILPARLDIQLYAAATLDVTLTVTNTNADGSAGPLFDLSGYSALMIVYKDGDTPATPQDTFSTANGRITLGGAAGTIRLQASSAIVSAYAFANGHFDLALTSAAGVVTPLLSGLYTIQTKL